MTSADILADAFGRVDELVGEVLDGIGPELLRRRPAEGANPIGWLLWHASRVQDAQIAAAAGRPEIWTEQDWYGRFGLPYPAADHGYGQSTAEVGQFGDVTAELLRGYQAAVHARTLDVLAGLREQDLDRVVDRAYRPPVTLAVRLVSIVSDCLQHLGQAAYLRGLCEA
jgi:hypothetical protein